MQKIIPNLWFNTQAEEAVHFYQTVFPQSEIHATTYYPEAGVEVHGMEPGTVLTIEFSLDGYRFTALNGGPHFTFTPAISFMVNCDSAEEVESLYTKLEAGGVPLMPLDAYPFSPRYGWIQDKYGVSWQIMLTDPQKEKHARIVPSLLFVGDNAGKAEEAIDFYVRQFDGSRKGLVDRYGAENAPDKEGTLRYADFMLEDQWFIAMDSAYEHAFSFNEAVSFIIMCADQQEIDRYWGALSAVKEAEQCGWLKDAYGVSWQVVPQGMDALLNDPDKEKANRAMTAMLQMKKIDIQKLHDAFNG